jgi:hypothetical protein
MPNRLGGNPKLHKTSNETCHLSGRRAHLQRSMTMHIVGVLRSHRVHSCLLRTGVALCLAIALASCGGGGSDTTVQTTPPPPVSIDVAIAGTAVIKLQNGAQDGVTFMSEKLTSLLESGPEPTDLRAEFEAPGPKSLVPGTTSVHLISLARYGIRVSVRHTKSLRDGPNAEVKVLTSTR